MEHPAVLQTPSRSFASYLQEAAEEEHDEPLHVLASTSPLTGNKIEIDDGNGGDFNDDKDPFNVAIYHSNNKKQQGDDDDNDIDVDVPFGFATPTAFSSNATMRSGDLPADSSSFVSGLISPFSPMLKHGDTRFEKLQFASLVPLGKLSCVVQVLPLRENRDDRRCIFPQVKSSDTALPQNVVVVNPSAFGKHIPSHVTLETARLVSRATDTSDWARLYNFHHVIWPEEESLDSSDPINDQSSIDSLSRAIAQDAMVELQSSVVISLGGEQFAVGGNEDSLWARVLGHCQGLMEEKMVCTISFVEILDERDSFRDLLLDASGDDQAGNGNIGIRHVDMKLSSQNGAIFENLTQLRLDAIPGMVGAVVQRKEPSSTTVGTISLWNSAISHELKKSPDSQITFVELVTFGSEGAASKKSSENDILRRQGIVSLGRALRQLLLHASMGTEPMISWRESTLTHVLQRRLECSKVIVLGSVSQLSKDYEQTLGILNFMNRLLIKPGETLSSPFRNSGTVQEHQLTDEISSRMDDRNTSKRLHEYARSPQLLEKIVADPRQRLARFFKSSSPAKDFPEINYAPSQDDYQAIDYMDYEDGESIKNEPTPGLTEQDSVDEKKLGLVNSASHVEPYELRDRFSPNPSIAKTNADSVFDQFSMKNADGNARLELGASPADQFRTDSEFIDDKAGTKGGKVFNSASLGHYSIGPLSENPTSEQTIIGMQNESQEQHSQSKGNTVLCAQTSDIFDSIAQSKADDAYVAAMDESSASTLGSGVRYRTMIGDPADNYRADCSTKVLENSGPLNDTHDSHRQGDREVLEIDKMTMTEVNVDALKKEAENLHNHPGLQNKKYEKDIQHLKNQLDNLLDAKKHVEKIAEEANSAQDDLEKQLLESRNELVQAIGDADLLRRERVDLLQEQLEFRQRLESMSLTMQASENAERFHESERLELQHTIEELICERDNLKRDLRDNERVIGDLTNEKQQIHDVQDAQRKEKLELIFALEEKDRELQLSKKQTEALASALEDAGKENSKIKLLKSHDEKEVSLLEKQLQNITAKCAELNSCLVDRNETVRKLQGNLKLVETSQEKLQSRIRELEQDRDRADKKMIVENTILSKTRENLEQMKLSVQEMKEKHIRFEKQQKADQSTISALEQELASEKAKRSFAERQRGELVVELRSIREASEAVDTQNANLCKHNLELLNMLEETRKDANCSVMSLEDKNQNLRIRLAECTAILSTCQIEKDDIENCLLTRCDDQHGSTAEERLFRATSIQNGFDNSEASLEQMLAEYKEEMNAELIRFRSGANGKFHQVRVRHEKVVGDYEELQSKFVLLEEHVLHLEKENVKLRYHRTKCLDKLRSGRARVALIGKVEAKPTSTKSVFGRQNSKPGSRILKLIPELYLTKSSAEFSGGQV